jgi:hypothetical protein
MKHLCSHRSLPLLVSVTLATVTLPALLAESHCPAGIASVTPRFVQRALIVIPVRINHKGPFDFMVDTDSQKPLVVVQDLGSIQAADPRIRGVLGENFLAHLDLLIDYAHKLIVSTREARCGKVSTSWNHST